MAWKVKLNQLNEEAEAGSPAGGALPVEESLDTDAEVFEALAEEFLSEEDEPVVVETPAEVPPVAEVPPPPVVTPPAAATTPAVSEPAKPDASAVPPVASPTPEPQTIVQPRREDVVSQLASSMAITNEDDIELLRTEPEKVIPKLMANLFYDMHATVMRQVSETLPNMLQDVQTRVASVREAEDAFYGQWPLLKDHADTVLSIGKIYRQMNPNADKATAIREIGAMAMVQAKIPFDVTTGKAIETATQPSAASQAFRPVVTSGVTPAPSAPTDEWSGLVEEFLREDLE